MTSLFRRDPMLQLVQNAIEKAAIGGVDSLTDREFTVYNSQFIIDSVSNKVLTGLTNNHGSSGNPGPNTRMARLKHQAKQQVPTASLFTGLGVVVATIIQKLVGG